MGKYGNIDGIATLTNDPLALDNINKFKVGDRVICNDNGVIGTVKELIFRMKPVLLISTMERKMSDREIPTVQRIIIIRHEGVPNIFS